MLKENTLLTQVEKTQQNEKLKECPKRILRCTVDVRDEELERGFTETFYFKDKLEMYNYISKWYKLAFPNGQGDSKFYLSFEEVDDIGEYIDSSNENYPF